MRNRKPYIPPHIRRRRREARHGMAIIAACCLALAGLVYGAAAVDQARGITVAQSLRSAGF